MPRVKARETEESGGASAYTGWHTLLTIQAAWMTSVDFTENGKFGKNSLDFVQHGPIMGVTFRW